MQKQATQEKPPESSSPESSSPAAEKKDSTTSAEAQLNIDLRDPWLAAFLAWLIPGAGHFYQRRWAKGVLFSICILGTFLYGFAIGGGKVVYASFRPEDRRLQYLCQIGVGLPALPALVQSMRMKNGGETFGTFMAPPKIKTDAHGNRRSELNDWQSDLHRYFELGTVFTMIAGLLNVLAIFDAACGPEIVEVRGRKKGKKDQGESPPGVSTSVNPDAALDYRYGAVGIVLGGALGVWVMMKFGPFGRKMNLPILALFCVVGAVLASKASFFVKRLLASGNDTKT